MANPNIVNVTTIYGKTSTANPVINTWTQIGPTVAANQVMKINSLYVCNVTGAATTFYVASNLGTNIAYNMQLPALSTLDLLSKPVYLTEGQYAQVYCTAAINSVYFTMSYELIS